MRDNDYVAAPVLGTVDPETREGQRWKAIAEAVQFSVDEWRDALPEDTPTGEWQVILWGGRVGMDDVIRAIQVTPREVPTAEDLARLNAMLAGIDKANLIKPGDENYPQRPLRQADRYFVTYPIGDEMEVTKEQYVAAERYAGFHSKFGTDEPATASWSSSQTGTSGRIEYATKDDPQRS